MSSFRHAHLHIYPLPSTPHVRKGAAKTPRSASSTPRITNKATKVTKHPKEEDLEDLEDQDDDGMASSFLQFCGHCEKQIVVPNASILYCSENCRRRDAVQPTTNPYLSLALASPTKMITSSYSDDFDDSFGSKIPTYVPAMQPTPRSFRDSRIPPNAHEGNSDLDPTEWKPAEPALTEGKSPPGKLAEWKPKLIHRPSSEAFQYLRKFHRSSDSLYRRRPVLSQGCSTISNPATPSLSDTPTASTWSEESLAGTPNDISVARPALSMPTRTTSHGTKGDKLVKDGTEFRYTKKIVATSVSATGSLKMLLETATGEI